MAAHWFRVDLSKARGGVRVRVRVGWRGLGGCEVRVGVSGQTDQLH